MKRTGFAEFDLDFLDGVLVAVRRSLEVSLDCPGCQRRVRTIAFDRVGAAGTCTPTGHAFDGTLTKVDLQASGARAEFDFVYEPFTDAKYPDERRYAGFEKGAPTWVRFGFLVRCSKCARELECSTQTNLVRPWQRTCDCGAPLYNNVHEPRLGWAPVAP